MTTEGASISSEHALGFVRSASLLPRGVLFAASLAFSYFFAANAWAQKYVTYHVAETGNDANDCAAAETPCLTIQHAVDLVQSGEVGRILVADGTYRDPVNVYYYKAVDISGNCDHPDRTTLTLVKDGAIAFWAQDHSILGVACFTVNSSARYNAGIASRQFAIIDFHDVHFGAFTDGVHIASVDHGQLTCTRDYWIDGGARAHILAQIQSSVNLGSCNITIGPALEFQVFADVNWLSYLYVAEARFNGAGVGAATSAKQYNIVNSTLHVGSVLLPGDKPGSVSHNGTVWSQ